MLAVMVADKVADMVAVLKVDKVAYMVICVGRKA